MPFIQSKKSAQPAQTDWKILQQQDSSANPPSRQSHKAKPGSLLKFPIYQVPKKWDRGTIKSSYTIWIGRSLWTLVCSISNVSLFANFPIIPTFSCSISQDFNSILCAFRFLPFIVLFSYLLFSSYTKTPLFYMKFST